LTHEENAMDPGSAVEILRTAGWSGASALTAWKVFGPSILAFGSNAGVWTQRWSANLFRIAERAEAKLGDESDAPGEVSPRILQRLVNDGAWCDDDVAQDYFAGLVAGSRSTDGGDDSNVPAMAMLSRLGSMEIRLHYCVYTCIRRGLAGGWSLGTSHARNAAGTVIPREDVAQSLGVEHLEAVHVIARSVPTLIREGLLAEAWGMGDADNAKLLMPGDWEPPTQSLVVTPTLLGLDLALRADGPTTISAAHFLYAEGWDELPEIDVHDRRAQFPVAPRTLEALRELREKVGYAPGSRAAGWALPPDEEQSAP
jgi:hypothetical protein